MEWADSLVPWYAKPFVKLEVDPKLHAADNARALGRYDGPLLVMQGGSDELTPPQLARKLYETVPSNRKTYKEVPGYGHGNLGNSKEYFSTLSGFLGTL
jgi:pimeloyl-ACP methyl ester carboxylesterase